MLAAKRRHSLSRLLANIAGWFGGRSHHRATTTGAAAMTAPLAMTGGVLPPAKSLTGLGTLAMATAASADARPADAAASSILILPLPSGMGWSADVAAEADDAEAIDIDADDIEPVTDEDLVHALGLLPSALAADPVPAVDLDDDTDAGLDDAGLDDAKTDPVLPVVLGATTGSRPLLLARQLRGVARLNKPASRKASAPGARRKAKTKTSTARASAATRAATAKRTQRPVAVRGKRIGLGSAGSRPARWPAAQAWILTRSAVR